MKLQKEQLIHGQWYKVLIYNSNYTIKFAGFRDDGDSIIVSDYYYESDIRQASDDWGYYKDIDTLEVATELPTGEKLIAKDSSYEIY